MNKYKERACNVLYLWVALFWQVLRTAPSDQDVFHYRWLPRQGVLSDHTHNCKQCYDQKSRGGV